MTSNQHTKVDGTKRTTRKIDVGEDHTTTSITRTQDVESKVVARYDDIRNLSVVEPGLPLGVRRVKLEGLPEGFYISRGLMISIDTQLVGTGQLYVDENALVILIHCLDARGRSDNTQVGLSTAMIAIGDGSGRILTALVVSPTRVPIDVHIPASVFKF